MVEKADAIVTAVALESHSRFNLGGGIETVTTFSIEETLKGRISSTTLTVVEPGGTVGDVSTLIAGVPQFTPGDRVLLFVRKTGTDRWAVAELAVGKFSFVQDLDRLWLMRDADDVVGWDSTLKPYHERPRAAEPFLRFIREVAAGNRNAAADYFAPPMLNLKVKPSSQTQTQSLQLQPAIAPYTATSYTMLIAGSQGGRWAVFPSAVTLYSGATQEPGAPGGGTTAINAAFTAWNNDCGSNVNYVYGGTDTAHSQGLHAADGANTILFERDLSSYGIGAFSCSGNSYSGTLGIGGITTASGTNSVNGETFATTQEADVEMNRGIANCMVLFNNGDFNSAVAHEVGHTLAFRHSDQNRGSNGSCSGDASLECSSSAIMKSFIPTGLNASLQAWDQHAVQAVYPGNVCAPNQPPPCTPPSITAYSPSRTITAGSSTTLSVTATGTAPLSYQWYIGTSGSSSSSPIPSGTSSSVTVGPSSTTNYWVRVSNSCGNADSATITVTVSQPANSLPNARFTNSNSNAEWKSVGAGDFSGDGRPDILFHNSATGQLVVWFMNGTTVLSNANFLPTVSSTAWRVAAVADFNRNGRPDILFQHSSTGQLVVWIMNGMQVVSNSNFLPTPSSTNWRVVGAADFSGDGNTDLLFENMATGQMVVWRLNGTTVIQNTDVLPSVSSTEWLVVAVADFNRDGSPDIVFRHQSVGYNVVWLMNHLTVVSNSNFLSTVSDLNWRITAAADFSGDGNQDLLWQNSATLQNAFWYMSGLTVQ